jgi:hypothetical protein
MWPSGADLEEQNPVDFSNGLGVLHGPMIGLLLGERVYDLSTVRHPSSGL